MTSITVISLGRIVAKPGFSVMLQGKPVVFPDGYCMQRPVFSTESSSEEGGAGKTAKNVTRVVFSYQPGVEASPSTTEPYFIATVSVSEGGNSPLFTIERSDDATKRYQSTSPTTPWREAIMAARDEFGEKVHVSVDAAGRCTIPGIRYYGLHLTEIQQEVKKLPHADELFNAPRPNAASAPSAATASKTKPAKATKKTNTANEHAVIGGLPTASPSTCPDCGLSGTPFCAATGRPHSLPEVCSLCGLSSSFCPVTGKPHNPAAQRSGRKRGEVHLPKPPHATRGATKGGAKGSTAAAEVSEVTVVSSQESASGRRRRPRSATTEGDEPAAPPRRARGKAARVEDDTPLTELFAAIVASEPPAPPPPPPPPVFTLRPPLSHAEQQKASQVLGKRWREQEEQILLPPQAAQLPIGAGAGKRGVARRGGRVAPSEAEDDGEASSHPLEVRQLATSIAGKRFVKFMLQHTSDRTRLEAIRSGASEGAGAKGRREKSAPQAEEGTEAAVVVAEDAQPVEVDAPAGSE